MTTPLTANILQPLIDIANAVLQFFHDDVGLSWGMSIIALTVVTRAVLLPLTYKQLKGMRALQALQPQLKEIQEKYKNDKQRMQQEMMRFYKENKVNPLASCFPLLAQLPIFITLFFLLRDELPEDILPGEESFLFINDLTEKAVGGELIVLLVLYIGTQLISGLVMSVTADKSQRMLMFALPLIFVPFILNFPAGLILYWITTNFWTIGQQLVIQKVVPPPAAATAGGTAAVEAAKPPPPPPRKKKKRR
ncbi:MAG TPA: YidC/Oxa1 family membrane protein insertase [Solirubrobacterales bacterium]|nr:YidC/Oxa1 family membrane protein insertase [Solirubrobacterales bacterium]